MMDAAGDILRALIRERQEYATKHHGKIKNALLKLKWLGINCAALSLIVVIVYYGIGIDWQTVLSSLLNLAQ